MNNKYRILKAHLSGYYRVQVKYWYWPFSWYDTHYDLFEDKGVATGFIEWHRDYNNS